MSTNTNNQTPAPIIAALIIGAAIIRRRRAAKSAHADAKPIGQSEDGAVQVFSMTDQTGAKILTVGNNWRIDGLGLAPEGFTTEGWVLNGVRLEADGINAEAVIIEGDSDKKKHIVVRVDDHIANPGDYEVTFHFDLQEYDSIESESFTVTQMIRVRDDATPGPEDPTPPPAPEPVGQSEDGKVQVYTITDQTGAEILTAGNNWRIDGLGLAPEGFTTEGWVLNNVRLEANGIDAEAVIVEGDSDKKHIVVRASDDIAAPGDYEVVFHFDLQEYGTIESESFNVTRVIRVRQV